MNLSTTFYENALYPLQDDVLAVVKEVDTGFYLTGGTVISRVYCHHRYSDDLDFFVNDQADFLRWGDRIIVALQKESLWELDIQQREETFIRFFITRDTVTLKVEMVNDVPFRVGKVQVHKKFGKIDTLENLFSNKISAVVDRKAPKDLADIWAIITQFDCLSVGEAILSAQGKVAGLFPINVAKVLLSASIDDWRVIRWKNRPAPEQFLQKLHDVGQGLILE